MYQILYSEEVPFELEMNVRNNWGNPRNAPPSYEELPISDENISDLDSQTFEFEIPQLQLPELPSFDFMDYLPSERRAPLLPDTPAIDDRVFRVPMNLPADGIQRDPTTQLHQTSRFGIAATFEGIRQAGKINKTIQEESEAVDEVLRILPKRPLFRILLGR